MGNAALRRARFFKEHPTCCFCGGNEKATTIDHIPSKALFNSRAWPEGYEFPACDKCNAATAKHEMLAAMICRVGKLDSTEDEKAHNVALMRGVHNNFGDLLSRMAAQGPIEKRKFLRETKMDLPAGSTSEDFGLFSVEDERVQTAMQEFSRKLLLALFYRHTKAIFPHEGRIGFRWYSNANFDDIHPVVQKITPKLEATQRANTSLGDQFFYRYGVADTGRATAFIAFFNESAAVLGVMFTYDPQVEPPPLGAILMPFDWRSGAPVDSKHEEGALPARAAIGDPL